MSATDLLTPAEVAARTTDLLTPKEVARRFHMTPESLSNWRRENKGPKFIRFNKRRVMYRLADVLAWENARETGDAK